MSGVWSNYWDWSKRRVGNEGNNRQGNKLGPNRMADTYYGNAAGEILGQKNGRKKLLHALDDQGAEREKGRMKRFSSGSGQLLGGGNGG